MSATGGSRNIDEIEVGDRVIAQSDEEPFVAAVGEQCEEKSVLTPRSLGHDDVLAYDPHTGDWNLRSRDALADGDTFIAGGQLFKDGEPMGAASPEDFQQADATYNLESEHGLPCNNSWVLWVGPEGEVTHQRLAELSVGERFAYQGRLMERLPGRVRISGEVLGRVVGTTSREAPTVLATTVRYPDGSEGDIRGTPEHPFFVPSASRYVSLRRLVLGTMLQIERGQRAEVVGLIEEPGAAQVFNLEVEAVRNYFVGQFSRRVLVHNQTVGCLAEMQRNKYCRNTGIQLNLAEAVEAVLGGGNVMAGSTSMGWLIGNTASTGGGPILDPPHGPGQRRHLHPTDCGQRIPGAGHIIL